MNERTLEVLEFDRVRQMLAEETSFPPGRDAALALMPSTDRAEVERRLRETSEARRLLDSGQGIPLGGLRDVRAVLDRARAGGLIEPAELLDIAQTCEGASRLRRFFLARAEKCPVLSAVAAELEDFPELVEEIGRSITGRGEVADGASKKLADIRAQSRATLARVRDKLEAIIRSAEYRKALQEPVITLREGRYVVPVRSEARDALPGVVHDRSASGVTLFVEPLSAVPLNNELRELALRERDEVARILRELTEAVLRQGPALLRTVEVLGHLDLCVAKGRLSARLDAVEPALAGEACLDLRQARHPLLRVPPPGRVVPVDVRIGRDFDTMVITGPNTGGKTVTLKTVGLLALMAMAGLHVPAAEGSVVSVFRGVWADIGDEQSIEQNLSTFSAHLENIIGIIRRIDVDGGEGQLVLLDEIGAGTDPVEGAALAMALLEYFHSSGARTIATTHYSEIKAFAYERPRMTNASVEFDVATLAPTYRLTIGLPGRSNALEIAARLGLSEGLIERARAFLRAEERHDVPALIQRLEEDRARVAEELRVARQAAAEAREMRDEQARKWANLRASEEKVLERAREEARQIVRQARLSAATVLAHLRETEARLEALGAGVATGTHQARPADDTAGALPLESRRRLDRLEQAVRDLLAAAEKRAAGHGVLDEGGAGGELAEAAQPVGPTGRGPGRPEGEVPSAAEVKVGKVFWVAGLGHFGEVTEPPDEGGVVGLLVGSMRLTVHLHDLRVPGRGGVPDTALARTGGAGRTTPARAEAAGRGAGAALAGSDTALDKALTVSPEISLRGLTVEEALSRLEKYLDDALLAGLGTVRVIHGKGTGALRQAVRDFLDEHPEVRGHYLADQSEGGLGATVVLLKTQRP